jgi:polysaccharide chain length determinant protein (PEP-CTERM system associated)
MINPEKSFNILDYFEILLRRIWYIVIPFVLILIGAVFYAVTSPKEYRASTLILVTPQKVPETLIRPTVTSRIEDRLQSIGQEIMSRTRLEQVIAEFKLYSNEAKSLSKEEVIELMRRNIKVELKGKEGFFSISYIGKDPRIVPIVTNKLASLFIEENLKLREQQAQGTSEFLSVELNSTKTKLEEQEKAMTQFRRQHMGELPEQRDSNLKVLDQLQVLYQRIGESIRAAQDRKLILQKQMSDLELMIASAGSSREEGTLPSLPGKAKDPQETQLEQLKAYLIDLQGKYTEKHPDILVTKKKIADLEAKLGKGSDEKADPASSKVEASSVKENPLPGPVVDAKRGKKDEKSEVKLNPRYKELESQLIATELEIQRYRDEETRTRAQMTQYRDRIENTPIREQAMVLLARDYTNTRDSYQTLLKKSEEAQQAENLERRQKGEQFKVIDPARFPEKPFRPDVPKIILFGLLLGLGFGFGLAFLREQMDQSFRDAEDLETTFGLRVLANIPKIKTKPV